MDPEPDPEPDPELSEKSDPEPDPEIIFSAPTHCQVLCITDPGPNRRIRHSSEVTNLSLEKQRSSSRNLNELGSFEQNYET